MVDRNNEVIRIKLPSDPKFISVLRSTVSELAQKIGFSFEQANDIKLALNEACANVIEHAYKWQKNKSMFVYFIIHPDALEIVIKDFGKKTAVDEIKPRELEDYREGGLGVFLIQNLVDEVHYDTSPKIGTELRFIKRK